MLQYWSIFYTSTLTIRAVGSAPGSLAGTGTPATFQPVSLDGKTANLPVPTPTLPKDFSSSFRRIPLDYALTNLPTFASAFSISPGYGDKAFPRIP